MTHTAKAIDLIEVQNADGNPVGFFYPHQREFIVAAQNVWNDHYGNTPLAAKTRAVSAGEREITDVEVNSAELVDYVLGLDTDEHAFRMGARSSLWLLHGAEAVTVQRFEVGRYRHPDRGWRSAELEGSTEPSRFLYVLTVRAPRT